jgi:hypothetical protein
VLELMCSMLGFTDDDRAKLSASRKQQGWREISLASDATLAPGSAASAAKQSLTDSWVHFLQQQIEAEAAGGGGGSGSGAGGAPPPLDPFRLLQQQQQQQQQAPIL